MQVTKNRLQCISKLPYISVSKQVLMQTFHNESEFDMNENEHTKICFAPEAVEDHLEMAGIAL